MSATAKKALRIVPVPCRWCGKTPSVQQESKELWWVICQTKRDKLPDHNVNTNGTTKEMAIDEWNRGM